jgi:hypothetical protein
MVEIKTIKTLNYMKNSITILFICFIMSIGEINAQKIDSTAKMPIMKQKYQVFVAEIVTNEGTKKGIFYDADSSKVVILDSLYHSISIAISDIKTLIIRRSNALGFNFRVGFFSPFGFFSALSLLVISDGLADYGLLFLGVGTGFSLFLGLVLLAGATSPNMKIQMEGNLNNYYRKLRSLKERSQVHLLFKSKPRPRYRRK